jgi:hypothetical protein
MYGSLASRPWQYEPTNLKIRCQVRFTEEHPELDRVGQLLEEEKQRQQILLNKIVKRCRRRRWGQKIWRTGSHASR